MAESAIAGYIPPPFRFGGPGASPLVAHADLFSASLPGSLAGPGVATTAARSDILPVGVPLPWLTGTPPSGFIMMDGSNVSRTTYAPLFALWGTTYGVGDGSTTFGLPDWRGRSIIGAGTGSGLTARTLGTTGGEESHALSIAELASHDHGNTSTNGSLHQHSEDVRFNTNALHTHSGVGGLAEGANPSAGTASAQNTGDDSPTHIHATSGAGSGTAHNNMQPWFAVAWIVRAV